jgi:glutathione S-transferase
MPPVKERLKPDSTFKIAYGGQQQQECLEKPRFILAYWSIRGLGAPLRMMLTAAQVNHWIILYDATEKAEHEWDKNSYLNDKAWLLDEYNPLINLPFLVDCSNDRVIVQSGAIFCYLGRELNMLGTNSLEQSVCEELLCEIMDIRNHMVRFAYRQGTGNDKDEAELVVKIISNSYAKLEAYLRRKNEQIDNDDFTQGSGKPICYLVGDHYSAPDFHLFEMLDQFDGLVEYYELDPVLLGRSHFPLLAGYKIAFESLPEISVYRKSAMSKVPFNSPYARFGSDPLTHGTYQRGMPTPWKRQGVIEEMRSKITENWG